MEGKVRKSPFSTALFPASWLDLSTGISPFAYAAGKRAVENGDLRTLPSMSALRDLESAQLEFARASGGVRALAASGTQMIVNGIRLLSARAKRVAVLSPTYFEHARNWPQSLHRVASLDAASGFEVVVAVSPNNPTGSCLSKERTRRFLRENPDLRCLVVDEAFVDARPDQSLLPLVEEDERVLILRSFSKFFGLGGLRLAFALGKGEVIERLRLILGPWPVSTLAMRIGRLALSDAAWVAASRRKLLASAKSEEALLRSSGFRIVGHTAYFSLCEHEDAVGIMEALAAERIWVRHLPEHDSNWLRFGRAGGVREQERMARALGGLVERGPP